MRLSSAGLCGLFVLVAACGDSSGGSTGGDTTGSGGSGGEGSSPSSSGQGGDATASGSTTASSGDSSASGSSTSTGDASSSSGTGGGGPVGPEGLVVVSVYRYLPDTPATRMDAYFQLDDAQGCEVLAREGSCTLSRCPHEIDALDAGTISIGGGDLATELTWPAYIEDLDGELAVAGDQVTASGPGTDAVPAFDLAATFPGRVEVTQPTYTEGVLPTDEDLAIAWTGGATGTITVLVNGGSDFRDPEYEEVVCEAPATAGALAVPAALLGQMATVGTLIVSVVERETESVSAGDWSIALTVSRYADAENGEAGDAFGFFDVE